MKNFIFTILFLSILKISFASPTNSISIPNSFTPNTTISSSSVNANFNEAQTKFNVHSHEDITKLGAITAGTWTATVIDETYGGLGSDFSATAQGNLLYFSGTGTVAALTPGTTDYPLVSNGTGANPAYEQLATTGIADLAITNAKIASSTIDLTAKVTNVLPDDNGGTGFDTFNTGTITVSGSSTGNITFGTAFADTNYRIVQGNHVGQSTGEVIYFSSKLTTGVTVNNNNAHSVTIEYIAVGN